MQAQPSVELLRDQAEKRAREDTRLIAGYLMESVRDLEERQQAIERGIQFYSPNIVSRNSMMQIIYLQLQSLENIEQMIEDSEKIPIIIGPIEPLKRRIKRVRKNLDSLSAEYLNEPLPSQSLKQAAQELALTPFTKLSHWVRLESLMLKEDKSDEEKQELDKSLMMSKKKKALHVVKQLMDASKGESDQPERESAVEIEVTELEKFKNILKQLLKIEQSKEGLNGRQQQQKVAVEERIRGLEQNRPAEAQAQVHQAELDALKNELEVLGQLKREEEKRQEHLNKLREKSEERWESGKVEKPPTRNIVIRILRRMSGKKDSASSADTSQIQKALGEEVRSGTINLEVERPLTSESKMSVTPSADLPRKAVKKEETKKEESSHFSSKQLRSSA